MYTEVALVAYTADRLFGEFGFIRHPVVLMGDYIKWFEERFYTDSFISGVVLTISLIALVYGIAYGFTLFLSGCEYYDLQLLISGIIASTAIASKMLYDSVKEITTHPKKIRYLVSRDTQQLSPSDINKAAIETYAENLSDGVVAPLFYLLLFGLPGAFVYKAVNTLDSMIGYRNERYERFGKFAAKLDDVVNYIPARITAVLIVLLTPKIAVTRPAPTNNRSVSIQHLHQLFTKVYKNGKHHESPNAGYPISAMALSLGVKLGGDTSYFGKIKSKPYFGEGKEEISIQDIVHSLTLQPRLNIFIIVLLGVMVWV